jgi:YbgC/YbaW family acyl-CoA thioester hydrolase
MFDFGYFIRAVSLFWRYKGKGKSKDLFDESIVKGRCWTNDLDLNWHMNNSRYLRECDFGRTLLILETGLWDAILIRRKNGMKDVSILVSALQVQYRQSVELGDTFEIRTRINGWDDKAFYLEQSIILDKNKQIAFSMLVRFGLTPRSLTPQMLVDDLYSGSIQSPTLSPAVQIFKDNYRLNYEVIKSKI